jgi:tRNA nucleotidyltransferase (CCA-adding enzyme)
MLVAPSANLVGPKRAGRRAERDHEGVRTQSADVLWQRLQALPAARPLLTALEGIDGVYVVGGAVRDLLLGSVPLDLDLVVDGDLKPVVSRLGVPARVHDRFGTCNVTLGSFSYDIARARRERYARPGALPDVAPASLTEDLGRRDFTVNALALGLGGKRRGELVAVASALEDLEHGRLRVLHDASFVDDPTRLLRLARYSNRLGFTVEEHTLALAGAAVAEGALGTVSGARIGAELRLLVQERDPVGAFARLRELELDAALAPGFGLHEPGVAQRALALAPADADRGPVVLAGASMRVPAGALAGLLDRLAFTAGERDTIIAAATGAERLARMLAAASGPSQIAAAVGGAGPEQVALAGALGPTDVARRWLAELRHVKLEIGGDDLLAAGVAPGPALGAGLRGALAAKLDGRVDGREQELAEAVSVATAGG